MSNTLHAAMATPTATNKPAIEATIYARVLTLTFSNGKSLEIDADRFTDVIVEHCIMHGLKQKLVDAAAIARNTDTGKSATVDDKFAAVLEVYERLLAGQWNKGRAEGGSSGGLLLRAIMQLQGKDRATVETWLATKSKAEHAQLRANPRVAAIIATLKPEAKPSTGMDTDSMLDELGG